MLRCIPVALTHNPLGSSQVYELHTVPPRTGNYWEHFGCSALFQASLVSFPTHLDAVRAAWLSYEPVLRFSLPQVPMPLPPPTSLGQDCSPLLFMEINDAPSGFPAPHSHHHTSWCPPQDPARSKNKPGGSSQDPHPNIQPNPPAPIVAPVPVVVPIPQ